MKEPVFIIGAHKSGTSLLRSLFDGHEALFALPIETHLAKHMGWWTRYPLNLQRAKPDLKLSEFTRDCLNWIKQCNRADDKYGDSRAKAIFNEDLFEAEIKKLQIGVNDREMISGYFSAIYKAVKGESPGRELRFLEKSVENSEHVVRLRAIFPDAKFIHILRNPYSNLFTLRNYMQKMDPAFPQLDKLIQSIFDSSYYARKNELLIPDYKVLRYEDLVTETEQIMKDLATFLGIEFDSCLLDPTYLGGQWSGNSVSDVKFNGISSERINQWKQDIDNLEINMVNAYLGNNIALFGYEKLPDQNGVLLPRKREGLKAYIGNRIHLKRPF